MTKSREKAREEVTAEIEVGKKKIRQLKSREKVLGRKLSQEERRTRSSRLALMSEEVQVYLKKRTDKFLTQSSCRAGDFSCWSKPQNLVHVLQVYNSAFLKMTDHSMMKSMTNNSLKG